MGDFNDATPPTTPDVDTSTTDQQTGGDVPGDNPAWEPIRSAVDDTTYQLLKPHLTKFDQDAQQRVRSTNERYAWANKLIEGGMTSDEVMQAADLAHQLANNPLAVFENLNGYVRQYFPDEYAKLAWIVQQQQAAADQQQGASTGDEDDDPRFAELRRQQAELAQQQDQQRSWFEQAEMQRMYAEASAQIDAEYRDISAKRPDLQKEDWKEIMGYAASQTQTNGKPVTVTDAVAWFDSIANRIKAAPRAGDSAPALLPLGGGNPGAPKQVDYSKLSDAEIQAMIAADVDRRNKQT